jgi:ubiquinone biosynthesis protein
LIILRTVRIAWAAASLLAAGLGGCLLHRRTLSVWPIRLRLTLERLGPTFVKIGQALSQRSDLLPVGWIAELSRLQGHASPFPGILAAKAVEAEFGAPISQLFLAFDLKPMAAASVAQVHRGMLKDGREVVVKILRPGVRAQIEEDMRILLAFAAVSRLTVPSLHKRRFVELVRELRTNLLRETDLREEARNIRRFAFALNDSKTIVIPDVIDKLSATTVLVQEMSRGREFGDPSIADQASALSQVSSTSILQQFFVLGFFHADPHPGNIFVMSDGRLCFHDFGAVGALDRQSRQALLAFVQGFIQQDPDWLTDAAIDLALLAPNIDRAVVARGVEAILTDLKGAPMQNWSIAAIMLGVARLGGGGSLMLPPHLAALVRILFTAEGTLRLLDPNLNIVRKLAEGGETFLSDHAVAGNRGETGLACLKWEAAVAVRSAPAVAAEALHRLGKRCGFSVHLPEVSKLAGGLARAADRMAVALGTLGLYIAASMLMQHSIGRAGGL